ncbi:MAG: hypothetical protein CL912_21390 [Deltaproteobacteria bacterium]|nr:hypothetical protein [Deltaproteobacteria bacterium]
MDFFYSSIAVAAPFPVCENVYAEWADFCGDEWYRWRLLGLGLWWCLCPEEFQAVGLQLEV